MSRPALEWYELLARGLIWAAGIVLLLSLIAAVIIASSETPIPGLEEAERQGRGFFALASLGGGVTSAGLLAGLGAILRMMVLERLAKLGPEPDAERDDPDPPPPPPKSKPARERSRQRSQERRAEKPETKEE